MKIETSAGSYFIDWKHEESHLQVLSKNITACFIKDEALRPVATDFAMCSFKDNFSKEKGRKISLARAVKIFDKSIRREIWQAYLNRKVKNGSNN